LINLLQYQRCAIEHVEDRTAISKKKKPEGSSSIFAQDKNYENSIFARYSTEAHGKILRGWSGRGRWPELREAQHSTVLVLGFAQLSPTTFSQFKFFVLLQS